MNYQDLMRILWKGKKKKKKEPLWPDLILEIQVHDDVV